MKPQIFLKALVFAGATLVASTLMAQADPKNSGYTMFGYGSADANVWRSGHYGGKVGIQDTLCWRTGFWTPAMAVARENLFAYNVVAGTGCGHASFTAATAASGRSCRT